MTAADLAATVRGALYEESLSLDEAQRAESALAELVRLAEQRGELAQRIEDKARQYEDEAEEGEYQAGIAKDADDIEPSVAFVRAANRARARARELRSLLEAEVSA